MASSCCSFIQSIVPILNRATASAIANRFDLNVIPSDDDDDDDVEEEDDFVDEKMVGSIRTDRIVYISRSTGSRLGPPMKGDDSGC